GGRTLVVAEPLPAAEGALRAASRRPPGVPRPRMCTELLEPCAAVLL
ncbi:MAG: hypothetical protein AVDCRST_MAG93-5068, partial [uncultured Chloroflexia bacterium]